MKYKYFLFDWDGSLGATLPLWFQAFKQVFSENGVEINYREIGRDVIGDWDGPAKYGIKDLDKFFARMEEILLEKLKEVKLNEGALKLVEDIKKAGGRVAVVTSSKKRWVKGALRSDGLRDLVDVFLGKEDVTAYKPNPEVLELALKIMKGKKDEAIMIGDTVKDILAAKFAGMDSALYFPPEYEEYYDKKVQESLGATYIVKSFDELDEKILGKS